VVVVVVVVVVGYSSSSIVAIIGVGIIYGCCCCEQKLYLLIGDSRLSSGTSYINDNRNPTHELREGYESIVGVECGKC